MLYTPAWGAQTPAVSGGVAIVLEPFPVPAANTDLTATVATVATPSVAIPVDGAVLVAGGTDAAKLQAEAQQGAEVTIRMILPAGWDDVRAAFGGGPLLVRDGKAVFHTTENFPAEELTARDARAAIGQRADGTILLVAVDGRQPGYSSGMTTYELAQTMARLGSRTAVGVAYGRAVSAAFDGTLLNRPFDRAGTPLRQGLLVRYDGVYAPPVSLPVVGSTNRAQGERIRYKIVRPSTVTATVIGPDGVARAVDGGTRQPGVYGFTWRSIDQEGTWH